METHTVNSENTEDDSASGRIGRVEHHVLGYYRRVHEAIQDGFEETLVQDMFLENVFKQTEDQEIKLCQNQTISRILEEILPLGKSSQIVIFFKGLLCDVETVMYDRFGAHVLQTTLMLSLKFVGRDDKVEALNALIMTLSQCVRSQLESVVMDTYASHVLRTLLQVFGGLQLAEKVTRSKLSREQQQRELVDETRVILETRPEIYQTEFVLLQKELMKSKQLQEYIGNPSACPVLAVLLLVTQKIDKDSCRKMCHKLIKKCGLQQDNSSGDSKRTLPDVVINPISSHLIETIIGVGSDDILKEITESCFKGLILKLAKKPVANFILQRLIAKTKESESMDQIMSELSKGFRKILAANNTGVLLQLAQTCFLFPAHQETFVESLLDALQGFTPEARQLKAVILIGSLQSHDVLYPEEDGANSMMEEELKTKGIEIKLHGSLLLQNLLKFQNKRIVVNGFMALSPEELKAIACQPAGSYLLEHFMSNERIKDKKKDQLIDKMKNELFSICCDKSGSRAMESVFKTSSIKLKATIAEILAKKETQLHSDRLGRFVHQTCQLSQFKHRRHAWTTIMTKDDKKRKLFADFIGDISKDTKREGGNQKKQKKRKKQEGPS